MRTRLVESSGSTYDTRTYCVRHILYAYDNYAYVRHVVRNTYAHCTHVVRIFVVRRAEHAHVRQKCPNVARRHECVRNVVRQLYGGCTCLYVANNSQSTWAATGSEPRGWQRCYDSPLPLAPSISRVTSSAPRRGWRAHEGGSLGISYDMRTEAVRQ